MIFVLRYFPFHLVSRLLGTYRHKNTYYRDIINIKGKPGKEKLYKNMLKRRNESDTYLATDSKHRWSAQMTMKNDN